MKVGAKGHPEGASLLSECPIWAWGFRDWGRGLRAFEAFGESSKMLGLRGHACFGLGGFFWGASQLIPESFEAFMKRPSSQIQAN